MANVETPRSPSVQSFASADTVSIAFTSTPGSPAMPPVSDDAAARATHEATDVPAQPHRFYLDVRSLKLKLDDGTFYHVHRHFFERHAPRFAEQYLCGETQDIIEVHDVSSVDFQRFLSIIYPSDLGVCDIRTVDEWTSVLRLASKWSVISLRDVVIREIETLRPSPIDAILIAREFGLGDTWLVPALVALCSSSEPLEYEDAERLGLRTAIEIARIKELYLRSGESYNVEAAVRASDILLSSGANDTNSRSASGQLTPAPSTAGPTSRSPPTPAVPPASFQSNLALEVDPDRLASMENPSPAGNDNSVYLAMLADERAQAQLLVDANYIEGEHKDIFALTIARRLVTETSSAAIRHRDWRLMWLKLGGYASHWSPSQVLAYNFCGGKPQILGTLCRATASHIGAQCCLALDDPLFSGQSRSDVMTVKLQDTTDSQWSYYPSTYTVVNWAEDFKKLLDREGLPWSQEADNVTCILRVTIPWPSREWFVDSR